MKKKLNPLIMMSFMKLLRTVFDDEINMINGVVKSRFLYTLDLSVHRWNVGYELVKVFNHIPSDGEEIAQDVMDYNDDIYQLPVLSDVYYDIKIYNGSPIIMMYGNRGNPDSLKARDIILKFVTIRSDKNIRNLNHLIKKMMTNCRDVRRDKSKGIHMGILNVNSGNLNDVVLKNRRTFDDVFIPKTQRDMIQTKVESFVNSKEWYEKHHIPYHFGILLHGPAGTGKSSIIQAIINIWDVDNIVYIKSGDMARAFSDPDSWYASGFSGKKGSPSVIISEDIDVSSFTSIRKKDKDGNDEIETNPLGKVINFIDGVNSPTNVIYIFTTNHLDQLDPALVRPGRIDLCLEIDYVCNETMDAFLMSHFGKHLPDTRNVNDGLTFAKLQTEIMSGSTYGDIINEYTRINDGFAN